MYIIDARIKKTQHKQDGTSIQKDSKCKLIALHDFAITLCHYLEVARRYTFKKKHGFYILHRNEM